MMVLKELSIFEDISTKINHCQHTKQTFNITFQQTRIKNKANRSIGDLKIKVKREISTYRIEILTVQILILFP